eukprot:902805-Rhodomonas_salina.5
MIWTGAHRRERQWSALVLVFGGIVQTCSSPALLAADVFGRTQQTAPRESTPIAAGQNGTSALFGPDTATSKAQQEVSNNATLIWVVLGEKSAERWGRTFSKMLIPSSHPWCRFRCLALDGFKGSIGKGSDEGHKMMDELVPTEGDRGRMREEEGGLGGGKREAITQQMLAGVEECVHEEAAALVSQVPHHISQMRPLRRPGLTFHTVPPGIAFTQAADG